MSADVIYPEYNDSAESVGRIRELLLGDTKDPCVILAGETDWVKLEKIGSIFRNTRPGTPFEARRYSAPADSEFVIFHVWRSDDCTFLTSNSKVPEYLWADNRPRGTKHVARFAFADKTVPAVPDVALGAPGPAQVMAVAAVPKKLIAGIVVTALLFLVRLKQVLASVDIAKTVSEATAYVLHRLIGNFALGVCAFETGIIGGLTTFYWEDLPCRALWVTRLLVYGGGGVVL